MTNNLTILNTKPIAKSLHTITVIVQVAEHLMANENYLPQAAVFKAMIVLGLDGRDDPYHLRNAAMKALDRKMLPMPSENRAEPLLDRG